MSAAGRTAASLPPSAWSGSDVAHHSSQSGFQVWLMVFTVFGFRATDISVTVADVVRRLINIAADDGAGDAIVVIVEFITGSAVQVVVAVDVDAYRSRITTTIRISVTAVTIAEAIDARHIIVVGLVAFVVVVVLTMIVAVT